MKLKSPLAYCVRWICILQPNELRIATYALFAVDRKPSIPDASDRFHMRSGMVKSRIQDVSPMKSNNAKQMELI